MRLGRAESAASQLMAFRKRAHDKRTLIGAYI
jgi:hypothetical protein